MSASARTWLGPVSPRRIARRVIGKKAGFPIGFIRLTSVDSVAPTMARTNGARVVRCAACSWNERIPLRVESIAGNCRWQRYELDRREREKTDSICVRWYLVEIKDDWIWFFKYFLIQNIFILETSYNHNIVTNINYGLISRNSTETKKNMSEIIIFMMHWHVLKQLMVGIKIHLTCSFWGSFSRIDGDSYRHLSEQYHVLIRQ